MVQVNDRVSASATIFDGNNGHLWSQNQFGSQWATARCFGTCTKVTKKFATILWDIDKATTKIELRHLKIEESFQAETSVNHTDTVESQAPVRKKRKTVNTEPEHPQPDSSDSDSSDSEDSEQEQSEEESAISRSENSDSDNPEGSGNQVNAHGITWTFESHVTIDCFKEAKFKPKIYMENIESAKEIDFWMLFFPSENIDFILQCTNANLRDRRKLITKGEFYKTIGIMYAMTVNSLHNRRDYWSTEDGLFPAAAFGKRFGQGYHRFEEILNSMAFSMPGSTEEENDKWQLVRPFYDMTTSKCRDVFSPGYKITIDESMFAWYGKGLHTIKEGGMPAVIKIKRKPKGVGCECKTLADVQTGIMIGIEINEGKNAMQDKSWQKELGAGTATTLRLTQPWFGTGRIVVGDSWFASVKTATELRKQGLFFLGIVKTATKMYPISEAKKRCPNDPGKTAVATATVNGTDLTCVAWKDKKVHTFIGSCSTTLRGEPAKKKRTDSNGQEVIKIVPRPKIVEEYFDGAPAVDIHNHLRQSGLALENSWSTQQWHHRMFASLFGIIEANSYLAYKYFKRDDNLKHSKFVETLSLQLINNSWIASDQSKNDAKEPDLEPRENHTLIPLSTSDDRQRVQRRCKICARVHNRIQKSSYKCSICGDSAIICSPTTGRNCFAYHVIHGIPN